MNTKKNKAKKKQGGVSGNKKVNSEKILKKDVKKHIIAVVLFMVALIFSLSLFGQAGLVGKFTDEILTILFGVGKFILPVLMMALGVMYFKKMPSVRYAFATGGMFLVLLTVLGLLHIFYEPGLMKEVAKDGLGGGYTGFAVAFALTKLIGKFAGVISLFSLMLIGIMLLINVPIFNIVYKLKDKFRKEGRDDLSEHSGKALTSPGNEEGSAIITEQKDESDSLDDVDMNKNNGDSGEKKGLFGGIFKSKKEKQKESLEELGENIKSIEFIEDSIVEENVINKEDITQRNCPKTQKTTRQVTKKDRTRNSKWKQPAISIFEKSQRSGDNSNAEENIAVIQRTLSDFGIKVEPSGYNIGPTVTQYTFTPPPGVMLNKIVGLQNNLALALAAPAIRIEAPIPGTSSIGIEVPNSQPTMIRMGSLLESDEFTSKDSKLTIAMGDDVNGKSIVASLEKMPHLLVAGSTNTGKSVCINAILSALIFKNSPAELQLILIDPKRVELAAYNGIPHLVTKVIVDMNKVVNTLKWATVEMDARYKLLEEACSKNIVSYNEKVELGETRPVTNIATGEITNEPLEKMPYIVIVIDELADLMTTHGKEVESLIIRLAQMARAVGIHLILSTQRPDANVITGTIKNNIPARIAFKVAGNVDSRTILDRPGAEKLLGNGDMLYMGPGYPQPIRIQGPFVSEKETAKLIKFITNQAKKNKFKKDDALKDALEGKMDDDLVSGSLMEGESSGDDVLYAKAKEIAIQSGQISISSLQRRLSIGYNRSAKIIDALEDRGVISSANGSKPRKTLIADNEIIIDEVSGPEGDMKIQSERDKREF